MSPSAHLVRWGWLAIAVSLVFAVPACAGKSPAKRGSADVRLAQSPTPSPSPLPTDADGRPVIRPACLTATEGVFRHVSGRSGVTPVLVLGHGPRGVVVGAQANGGICQTLYYARDLVDKGYHVAIFDWSFPYADAMATATKTLIGDGARKVVLAGFSRGALVGLGLAPRIGPKVVGVISVSGGPSADEGFPTIASLSRFKGAILLISSQDDPVFPKGTSASIAAAHAGPDTLLVVPGSAHALALLGGDQAGKIEAAIHVFLNDHLK